MKVRLGLLRQYIVEALNQADARMVGDGQGPAGGEEDLNNPEKIAPHLRGDEEKTSLGSPPEEEDALKVEIQRFFLQEDDEEPADNEPGAPPEDGPTPEPGTPPNNPGFYAPFDMVRDHTGSEDNYRSFWYRSPGRPAGGDGDPFRGEDPYAQLGFHPPKGPEDPTASPPAADGDTGEAALDVPQEPALKTGNTRELGPNAKKHGGGVASSDGAEEEGQQEEA